MQVPFSLKFFFAYNHVLSIARHRQPENICCILRITVLLQVNLLDPERLMVTFSTEHLVPPTRPQKVL